MGLGPLPANHDGRLRDAHKGETIWVIGSGPSLDYIDRGFFADKTCVCVNNVGWRLELDSFYTVTHYWLDAVNVAEARPDTTVICSTVDLGEGTREESNRYADLPNIRRFDTLPQQFDRFDPEAHWPEEPDRLIVGPTSLHMTMHFAHYLGAASIVLVGADCGRIDDATNFEGYAVGDNPFATWAEFLPRVANAIRARGTNVYSLNPFVNFALEGHHYGGPFCIIN